MQSDKLREDAAKQLRLVDDLLRQTPLGNKAHVLSHDGDRVGDKGDECWERLRGGDWLISAPREEEEAVGQPSCAHSSVPKDGRLTEDANHVVTPPVQAKEGIIMSASLPTASWSAQQALLWDCEQHAACATKAGWVCCASFCPAPCTGSMHNLFVRLHAQFSFTCLLCIFLSGSMHWHSFHLPECFPDSASPRP